MVTLAFYKAEFGRWYEKLIAWYTIGPFSHCELVFGDDWFSSSPRDGGVRYKKIFAVPGRWVFLEIDANSDLIRNWCDTQVGKKYDWRGFFNFILPIGYSRSKWFCSEICVAGLQQAGVLLGEKPHRFSPNCLWRMLQ